MNKPLKAASPRFYGLSAMTAALAASAALFLAGAVGAGGNTSTAEGVSAQAASAPTATASVVNVASLPRAAAKSGQQSIASADTLAFRSPLGKAGLALAKRTAETNAPEVDGPVIAAPRTPEGATSGFDGMANSGPICPYFGGTGGNGCSPSDQGIASNGDDVVQVVNTSFEVYDTGGSVLQGPIELTTFFGVPNVAGCGIGNDPNDPFLSDPRVLWDPADGHFYMAVLEVEGVFGLGTCTPLSKYWVAVSQTDDPTGLWNIYSINTAISGVFNIPGYSDYTLLGFNGDGLFIGGNLFDVNGFFFLGAWVLGMDKKAMQDGDPISPAGFKLFVAKKQLLDTVQPVASYGDGDGGPSGEMLINSFNIGRQTTGMVVWDFSNVNGAVNAGICDSGHQCISGVVTKTKARYSIPPNADNGTLCHDCLETIDNRISATPVYMHGNVYFTHDTAARVGKIVNANVLWGIIHPALIQPDPGCGRCSLITTRTNLLDEGRIAYFGETDTWFGAIQPDREGNLFVGYDYQSQFFAEAPCGVCTYPSSVYIARRATTAPGSGWPDSGVFNMIGTGNVGTDPFSVRRWGDYSAIGFETWDTNNVWFATQYSSNNGTNVNRWRTHIDEFAYLNQNQQ